MSVKYSDFYSDLDLGVSPKPKIRPSKRVIPMSGPSQSRMEVQRRKTEEPKIKHPVPVSGTANTKSDAEKAPENTPQSTPDKCAFSSEDEVPLSVIKDNITLQQPKKRGKAKFVTRDVGIHKYK